MLQTLKERSMIKTGEETSHKRIGTKGSQVDTPNLYKNKVSEICSYPNGQHSGHFVSSKN